MTAGEGLWDEYCSFFEKDFEEQLEYNRKRKEEFFERWKKTKTADHLLPDGSEDFNDLPVTTYEDYPALQRFGEKIENKVENNPKPEGKSWKKYYEETAEGLKDWIEDWIPGEYGACLKTTGSTAQPKWFPMGQEFMKFLQEESISIPILACSEERGETTVEKNDVILNLGVPIPYFAGYSYRAMKKEFKMFPSIEFTNRELNMKVKLNYIIKNLLKGQKINVVGGSSASQFRLFTEAVVSPEKTYKEANKSLNFGGKKILTFILYIIEKMKINKIDRAKEVLPVKGATTSGLDALLYEDFLTYHFDTPPTNLYGSTELGVCMIGGPNRKTKLTPILKGRYLEFKDDDDDLHEIDDLREGETYELIGTPFGTPLVRYDQGDLLTVHEFRDDGMPIFKFEGRKKKKLGIGGYIRLSERMAFKVMEKAGFENTNDWAVTKKTDPNEKLCFLIERKENKNKLIKKIYSALYETSENFRNYISDFNIENPSEIIDVEVLSRGSFRRYALQQMETDVPIGQYKSPKIISPENKEIVESLRRA